MKRATLIAMVVLVGSFVPSVSIGADASDFSGMTGWTIIAVTQVEDDFEGCDFDKPIKFMNGMVLSCSTFSYTYSFMPWAVIFAASSKIGKAEFYSIRALIGDRLYDMQPVLKK